MSDTGILVSLEDEERNRVDLDYTSRDFTAIRSQLVGLARGFNPDWQSVGETGDFGTLLLELFAYMGDVMHFYIDRTASEAFLGTAVRRQSLLYIADMLGYTPMGQQAASAMLTFTLDANAEEKVTLPKGVRVYNESSTSENLIVFETDREVILDPTVEPPILEVADVPATEGVVVRDATLAVSGGIPNAEYILQDKGVIYNTVSIRTLEAGQTVNWSFVSDITLARPTQTVFTTFLDDLDFTHVMFGDNAAGRIPPTQAQVFVTYRFGSGAAANDLGAGALTAIAPGTTGGADIGYVTVTNPDPPIGGTDPESVDAMRQSIPRAASRVRNRAITLNDYADLALQVPGVAKSVSYGTVYTAVHVRLAPQDGEGDTAYMQRLIDTVEYYMKDKIIVGSTVYAEPVDIRDLWYTVYLRVLIHVMEGFNRTSVRLQVETMLRKMLSFDTVDFGFKVTIGKCYRTVLAIQGVEWAEVMWLTGESRLAPDYNPIAGTAPTLTQEKLMAPHNVNPDPAPQTVGDLLPDSLRIPKFEDTEKEELESEFPGMTTEERTHDGLWVYADGGVPGT